jgi:hypothetical protein
MAAMREQLKSEKGQGRRRAKYITDGAAMAESLRRFPSRWRVDPMPRGYVVRDANGHALAYIKSRDNEYSRDNETEARQQRC